MVAVPPDSNNVNTKNVDNRRKNRRRSGQRITTTTFGNSSRRGMTISYLLLFVVAAVLGTIVELSSTFATTTSVTEGFQNSGKKGTFFFVDAFSSSSPISSSSLCRSLVPSSFISNRKHKRRTRRKRATILEMADDVASSNEQQQQSTATEEILSDTKEKLQSPRNKKQQLQTNSSSSNTTNTADSVTKNNNKQKKTEQHREPCNVVFTHTNADFDSLAAAVALSLLWSSSKGNDGDDTDHRLNDLPTHVVLPRGTNPIVQRFLAFHKHLLPLRGFKTILPEDVHAIGVVDAQNSARIGRGQAWLEYAKSIHIYDHHDGEQEPSQDNKKENNNNKIEKGSDDDKKSSPLLLLDRATSVNIEKVGSTTTLLVEKLRDAGIQPAPHEATLFCLGIRADTGGLVYESTTLRDAAALLWCMEQGASQAAISEFGIAKMASEAQREVLREALKHTQTKVVHGLRVSSVLVGENNNNHDNNNNNNKNGDKNNKDKKSGGSNQGYVAGLAQVCEEIMDLTDSDVFVMGATSGRKKNKNSGNNQKGNGGSGGTKWISLIGRASARAVGVDLNYVMSRFQGGGHPKAAAAALRCASSDNESNSVEQTNDEDAVVELANSGNLSPSKALDVAVKMIENQIPKQLVASSFMTTNFVSVGTNCTIEDALNIFTKNGLKSAPIIDDSNGGKYKSSLKLSDIVKAVQAGRSGDKVKGMIRTQGVKTVLPDTDLSELERLLIHEGVGRIPVIDDEGVLLGIITRTDVLRQHHFYDDLLG